MNRLITRLRLHLWRNGISERAALIVAALLLVFVLVPHSAAGLSTFGVFVPFGVGMILDAQIVFADFQALTVTVASANIYDSVTPGTRVRNIGIGEPLVLVVSVDVAPTNGNANETYTAQLETDSTSGFTAPVQVGALITIVRTDPVGSRYVAFLPPDTTLKQYLRVKFTLGGTGPTVTVSAYIIPQNFLQNNVLFASGFLISS